MRANNLSSFLKILCLLGALTFVASCAHKDLKAACSDINVPSTATAFAAESKPKLKYDFGLVDDCGPLKPVNSEN